MPFPPPSAAKLATCDPRLQDLFNEVVTKWPCIVAVGYRDQSDQDAAVAAGNSKDPWPTSKHNASPSLAVDVVPAPIDWNDIPRFTYFAGFVKGVAACMVPPVQIRWGGDFGGTLDPAAKGFKDYDHFELVDAPPAS